MTKKQDDATMGRPLLYTDVKVMAKDIKAYFKKCDDFKQKKMVFLGVQEGHMEKEVAAPRPYTVEGLANALGMDRHTLLDYEGKADFSTTIKEAKRKVLIQKIERGNLGEGSPDFIKFDLKNNFGYIDKVHTDNTNRGDEPVDPLDVESLDVW